MTEIFRYTDTDGDRIEVSPPGWRGQNGYMVRICPRLAHRSPTAVFLPADNALGLAAMLTGASTEPPQATLDPVPRAEYILGDMSIVVEGTAGDIPMDVAKALLKILRSGHPRGSEWGCELETELAGLLECPTSAIVAEVGRLQDNIGMAKGTIEQQRAELARRPTAAQLQQAERQAWDADRRAKRHETAAQVWSNDMTALAKALRAVGLQDMSAQPPAEVARRIAALGDENNGLRERLSAQRLLETDATMKALREETEAHRVVAEQLDKGITRERELHREQRERAAAAESRAAEARNELATLRTEHERVNHLIDQHLITVEHYRELLAEARNALKEVRAEFVSADTEQVEAADLSRAEASLIVGKIDGALLATDE